MDSQPTSMEAFVLSQWILGKLGEAEAHGAVGQVSYTMRVFHLLSQQGLMQIKVSSQKKTPFSKPRPISLQCELFAPALHAEAITLQIGLDTMTLPEVEQTGEVDAFLKAATAIVMQMEIAPYPKVRYGFMDSGSILGITSFRCNLSYAMHYQMGVYTHDDISDKFPFITETDPASYLFHFWQLHSLGPHASPGIADITNFFYDHDVTVRMGTSKQGNWMDISGLEIPLTRYGQLR